MNTQEHAREAMRLIREYGWVKGQLGNKGVGYCLVGALNRSSEGGGNPFPYAVCSVIARRIKELFPEDSYSTSTGLPLWNDAFGTQEKVNILVESFLGPKEEPAPVKSDPAHDFDIKS